MRFKIAYSILVLIIVSVNNALSLGYSSNEALSILGKDKNSREFKEFKEVWRLDKQYENSSRGIKVYVDNLNERVQSVLFAGDNYKSNGMVFSKYSSGLPFDIAFSDDAAGLARKLGEPEKLIGRNAFKFNKQNIAVEVAYAGSDYSKIYSIKYYHETTRLSLPRAIAIPEVKKQPVLLASIDPVFVPNDPKPEKAPETDVVKIESKVSVFKQAILDVFKAYKESAFYSVKDETRVEHNYWNYKYTYKTKLKIPGEKFNMLYSFPFTTSQLDFVSVLKEGDTFDKSFIQTYHEFEKKLMENFPAKDGWEASCIPNKESKTISDLEFRNDRYGAVVLDYCKNPKGKHIIYLRFLLFSN